MYFGIFTSSIYLILLQDFKDSPMFYSQTYVSCSAHPCSCWYTRKLLGRRSVPSIKIVVARLATTRLESNELSLAVTQHLQSSWPLPFMQGDIQRQVLVA